MLKEEDFKDEIMDLEESIENLILKKAKLSTCKISNIFQSKPWNRTTFPILLFFL